MSSEPLERAQDAIDEAKQAAGRAADTELLAEPDDDAGDAPGEVGAADGPGGEGDSTQDEVGAADDAGGESDSTEDEVGAAEDPH